jgi:hypothetical protein
MIPILMMRSLFLRYIVHLLCLINFSFVASHSANENPQVLEHVTPLAAEVGPEFGRAQAQAPRARKNKAPAPDAGPSDDPPAKRQKKGSSGPHGGKRKRGMPVATG